MTECSHCRKRYENGVRFCPVDGFAVVPVAEPLIGRTLMGQFQIQSVCGHGATGTVYRATQVGIDREVAVKILKPDLLKDPDVIKRFVREARAGARLNHPNIATVHLVGQTEEGVPFLVMEFVEGVALSALVGVGKPLPLRRLCHIGAQISSALAEAHGQGIVHRDLKPENILLTERRGESDVVKVVDFGIAKMVAHAAPGEDPISRLGTVFGTPHYIAPEQASGQAVDGRADIYSLGCILFQMATGRVPFDGQQGLQVLLRQVRDPVPDPRTVNPRINDRLATLILKMLAKEPAQRPQSASLVYDALRDLDSDDNGPAVAAATVPRSGSAAKRSEPSRAPAAPAPSALSDEPATDDWYQDDDGDEAAAAPSRPVERSTDLEAARRRRRRGDSERESRSGKRRPSRSGRPSQDALPLDDTYAAERSRREIGFWRRSWMPIVGIASAVALGTLAGLLYAHFHATPVPLPPPAALVPPPPLAPPASLVRPAGSGRSGSSARPAAASPPAAGRPAESGLPVTVFPAGPPLTGPQPLGPGPTPPVTAAPQAPATAPPAVAAPAVVASPPAVAVPAPSAAPPPPVAAPPPVVPPPVEAAKPAVAAEPPKSPPAAKPEEPAAPPPPAPPPPPAAPPAPEEESGSDPYRKLK